MYENEYTLDDLEKKFRKRLNDHIESDYNIRSQELFNKRRALLEKEGVNFQKTILEAGNKYIIGNQGDVNIDHNIKNRIFNLPNTIFPNNLYKHQIDSLNNYASEKNLFVATGTGSGKTECFLLPSLYHLLAEQQRSKSSWSKKGVRVLMLYPMNALVTDQLKRIRKLYGDFKNAKYLQGTRSSPIRFGSYTGRTPHSRDIRQRSTNDATVNRQRVATKSESNYFLSRLNEFHNDVQDEINQGSWPSKDIKSFFTLPLKGKNNNVDWINSLSTHIDDRELIYRHEFLQNTPDILVTNTAMLGYMMLRPIEESIFSDTKEWLQEDEENQLLIILDEAHLYKGAAGAEVAMLIRRLYARLGLDSLNTQNKIRMILTTASVPSESKFDDKIIKFAQDISSLDKNSFSLLKGNTETFRSIKLNEEMISIFSNFQLSNLYKVYNPSLKFEAIKSLNQLSIDLKLEEVFDLDEEIDVIKSKLYKKLIDSKIYISVMSSLQNKPKSISDFSEEIFIISNNKSEEAAQKILSLLNFAKDNNNVLVSTRAHMFFRGNPSLAICINSECSKSEGNKYGNLKIGIDDINCKKCGGRIYELLTHRGCGSAFISGFTNEARSFLWDQEPISDSNIVPIQLYMDNENELNSINDTDDELTNIWLHNYSGRLSAWEPENSKDWVRCIVNKDQNTSPKDIFKTGYFFKNCPVCNNRFTEANHIMDLAPIGEKPFSEISKEQLYNQPSTKFNEDENYPNRGKKLLIFSDGRQKAARLAYQLEVLTEIDLFRLVFINAISELNRFKEKRSFKNIYVSFLFFILKKNILIFSNDKKHKDHLQQLKKDIANCDNIQDLLNYLKEEELEDEFTWIDNEKYSENLLRVLCNTYRKLDDLALGYILPNKRSYKKIKNDFDDNKIELSEDEIYSLSFIWLNQLLSQGYFEKKITSADIRKRALGMLHSNGLKEIKKKSFFPKLFKSKTSEIINKDQFEIIEKVFRKNLCEDDNDPNITKYHISSNKIDIRLELDNDSEWYECKTCLSYSPLSFRNECINCIDTGSLIKINLSNHTNLNKNTIRKSIYESLNNLSYQYECLVAEEHTAQLNYKDDIEHESTLKNHERRFQDNLMKTHNSEDGSKETPIDILCCTTTLEVGVDIGNLVAVGLRNVPPERENYQQRAGRAGRRGNSLSTVVTYGQDGPHDNYYFSNPLKIIDGDIRIPEIKIDNAKIISRHIFAYLMHSFSQAKKPNVENQRKIMSNLGKTIDFFDNNIDNSFNYIGAQSWFIENFEKLEKVICEWVSEINFNFRDYVDNQIPKLFEKYKNQVDSEKNRTGAVASNELINFFMEKSELPSYGFPTNLSKFKLQKSNSGTLEEAQQSLDKAITEYAPGRQVFINKKKYTAGCVIADHADLDPNNPAKKLFDEAQDYIFCSRCNYVQKERGNESCPICNNALTTRSMITPEVFMPRDAYDNDKGGDQTYTRSTIAQFPLPTGVVSVEHDFNHVKGSQLMKYTSLDSEQLVQVNKGINEDENFKGFQVCEKCGRAEADQDIQANHETVFRSNRNQAEKCSGSIKKNIFLGHKFTTDIFLLRLTVENNITSWPGGRGACKNANGDSETFGRTLTQTSENIYSNTSNQLSRKQIYNLLSKSRFRPDR